MKTSNNLATRRSMLKFLGVSSLGLFYPNLTSNGVGGTISSAFAASVSKKLDTESIIVLLEVKLKPKTKSDFIKFLNENLPNVRGFKGARTITVLQNEMNMSLVIHEEWKSKEHHQNYIKYITENGVMNKLTSFLVDPPSMKYFKKLKI